MKMLVGILAGVGAMVTLELFFRIADWVLRAIPEWVTASTIVGLVFFALFRIVYNEIKREYNARNPR